MKKLLLITFLCSILGCNLESNKNDDDPKPNANYTGMRSVVDEDLWIEYLTGGIWTGLHFDIKDEFITNFSFNILVFFESETKIFTAPIIGGDSEYILGEFLIENNILYIKEEGHAEYKKYAEIETNNELIYNKEITLNLFIDGKKSGDSITFDFDMSPPNKEPVFLNDVILKDSWLDKLSDSAWKSEPVGYLDLTNSTDLVYGKEVDKWETTYFENNPDAYTMIEVELTEEEYLEELEFWRTHLDSHPVFEPTRFGTEFIYSEEYQKIKDSNYFIEISFDSNSYLMNCRIYSEDYEIANYTQEFFIIDNILYLEHLWGYSPLYIMTIADTGLLKLDYIDEKSVGVYTKEDFTFNKIN